MTETEDKMLLELNIPSTEDWKPINDYVTAQIEILNLEQIDIGPGRLCEYSGPDVEKFSGLVHVFVKSYSKEHSLTESPEDHYINTLNFYDPE